MRNDSRFMLAAAVSAVVTLTGCPAGKLPGGRGPGGTGMVDPNSCGNYAVSDAGRKLKAFLEATAALERMTNETVNVVKQSCTMIGAELGMPEAEMSGETKDVCNRVFAKVNDNLKVAFSAKAGMKVTYKPAVCTVDAQAQARAAAECEGKATADVGATCSGTCRGTCEGTCAGKTGTAGSGVECNGECQGTCQGQCEGHADVDASASCKADAAVEASVNVQCTEAELDIQTDASLVVDKAKAEQTINALKAGLPKLLSVKARLQPLQHATMVWAASARELAAAGPTLVSSLGEQAMCVSGQISAAAGMIGRIEANVSVSVEVSASASGSIGG